MKLRLLFLIGCAAAVACGQHVERVIRLPLPAALPTGDLSIARNAERGLIYLAGTESETLLIVDERKAVAVAAIEIDGEINALCFNPVSNKLYCADESGSLLYVIDGATDVMRGEVELEGSPVFMVLDSLDDKLYCVCAEGYVDVVDCGGDTLLKSIDALPDVEWPYLGCYVPSLGRVYCASSIDSTLVAIDCRTDSVVSRISVDQCGVALCYNPGNGLLYWSSEYDSVLMVVDPGLGAVVDSIPGAGGGMQMEFSPERNKLYSAVCDGFTVVDCAANAVLKLFDMDALEDLCWSPRGDRLLATSHPG